MDKYTLNKIERGEMEVLAKVEKFEDITFGHLVMAESIMMALGLDISLLMDAVKEKRKEKEDRTFKASKKSNRVKLTKRDMARVVVQALYNLEDLPDANDRRVDKVVNKNNKDNLKSHYDTAHRILTSRVK